MNELAQKLQRDHEQLERLLTRLSEDVESPCASDLGQTWNEFESCLARHFHDEEHHLLPPFLASHPDEVRSTLTEHQRIREYVAKLGIEVDLHIARKDAVEGLVRMLREHAQSEARSVYHWAQAGVSPERAQRL